MYTRCPHCATVYRVTPQQLQASSGQVKCGRCQAQFDAFASLAASIPGSHDARPAAAGNVPASDPSAALAAPRGRAGSVASSSLTSPAAPAPAPATSAAVPAPEVSASAEDQVAAYVIRYGGAHPQLDGEATQTPGAHEDALEPDDDELSGRSHAPSSIDQFADSLRVLQAVAQLSLEVAEPGTGPHADQPWVEAVTDAPDATGRTGASATSSSREEAALEAGEDEGVEPATARTATEGGGDASYAREEYAGEAEEIVLAAPPPLPVQAPFQRALTVPDALLEEGALPPRQPRRWVAAIASLALVLAVQGLWWFASPVAIALPGLRPALEGACGLVGCEVALPQLPDQLFIEGSDLQLLDVARPQEVLLSAQIRNRAAVTQQLPAIELTLIDTANRVVGRRVLRPAEYLEEGRRPQGGIAGNEEVAVRLYLNTGDLRAAGYRLYLFFG